MDYLFEEKYYKETIEFYLPYFCSIEEVKGFINSAFELDYDDRKPRQMIFQVQRFVTLANEVDKIRPSRDGLRILFLKCCMESLANLSDKNNRSFSSEFADCFSEHGESYILSNFYLTFIQNKNEAETELNYNLTINDFLSIIKATRDKVVHEGNYWEIQMFARDVDSTWLTSIDTDEDLLPKKVFDHGKDSVTYYFDTTLQYDMFIYYFTEACINYIVGYIERKKELHEKV